MTAKSDSTQRTPEAHLRSFIDRLDSKKQKLFRSVRAAVRRRIPTANEIVYDHGRSLVIGYSPTDRGIESIVAISARANDVSLYFNQGPTLPDPKKLLKGTGKQTRFVVVEAATSDAGKVTAGVGEAAQRRRAARPNEPRADGEIDSVMSVPRSRPG